MVHGLRHAKASTYLHLVTPVRYCNLCESGPASLRYSDRLRLVHSRKQKTELVSSNPRQFIFIPQYPQERPRDRAKQRISRTMTQLVVYIL